MTSILFVGNGTVAWENVKELVNDFLKVTGEDEEGYPLFPDGRKPTLAYAFTEPLTPGFEAALAYAEYADVGFGAWVVKGIETDRSIKRELRASEATDVVAADDMPALVASFAYDHAFVLWGSEELGEEPSELVENIVFALSETDTKLWDLTTGLSELEIGSPVPEEPERVTPPSELAPEEEELRETPDEGQQLPPSAAPDHLRVDKAYGPGEHPDETPVAIGDSPMLNAVATEILNLLDSLPKNDCTFNAASRFAEALYWAEQSTLVEKLREERKNKAPAEAEEVFANLQTQQLVEEDPVDVPPTEAPLQKDEMVIPAPKKRGRPRKNPA